jgi:hypothetical protein
LNLPKGDALIRRLYSNYDGHDCGSQERKSINVEDSFDFGLWRGGFDLFVRGSGISNRDGAGGRGRGRGLASKRLLWPRLSPRPLRLLRSQRRAIRVCSAGGGRGRTSCRRRPSRCGRTARVPVWLGFCTRVRTLRAVVMYGAAKIYFVFWPHRQACISHRVCV